MSKEKFEIREKGGVKFVLVNDRCIGTVEDVLAINLNKAKNEDPNLSIIGKINRKRIHDLIEGKGVPATQEEVRLILIHQGILNGF